MANEICKYCNGAGRTVTMRDFTPVYGGNCFECNGTGYVQMNNTKPVPKPGGNGSKGGAINSEFSFWGMMQALITLGGFILSALLAYDISDDQLEVALITGVIIGAVSYKFYKLIAFLLFIGICYYLYTQQ